MSKRTDDTIDVVFKAVMVAVVLAIALAVLVLLWRQTGVA